MHDVVADTALQGIVACAAVQRIVTSGAVEAVVAQRADEMIHSLAGACLLVVEDVETDGLAGRQHAAVAVGDAIAQVHDVGETNHRSDGKGTVVIVDDRAVIGGQPDHAERIAVRIAIPRQQLRRRQHIGMILRTVAKACVRARRHRRGIAQRGRHRHIGELQFFDIVDRRLFATGLQGNDDTCPVRGEGKDVVGTITGERRCIDAFVTREIVGSGAAP